MTVTFFLRTALAGAVATALAVTAAPTSAEAARNHRPDRPTGLTTSPATDCAATPPSFAPDGDVSLHADGTTKIGKPVEIVIAKGAGGVVPTGYRYSLNRSEHRAATADTEGRATITVTPQRFLNTLEVYGLSPAGNIGDSTTITFNSDAGDLADEGDLTGDGHTDLAVVGGANGLSSGLWLAAGNGSGGLGANAVNLTPAGIGAGGGPAEVDGAQVVTGRFTGGTFQDVLIYYPAGDRAGMAAILRGNGDGSPIRADISGNAVYLPAGLLSDNRGNDPVQLVRAAHTADNVLPDLIGIAGNRLTYIANSGFTGGYLSRPLPQQTTPTGDLAWNTWTLAGTATADGRATLFLWQKTTGQLYAWRDVTFDPATKTISYTEQHLSDSWYPAQSITPSAADINGDDVADLWAVGPTATATPWTVTPSGTITAGPAQPITPAP
ncbi:hypothetical protein [Actinoplanes sp. NBRC 103695]|uniref:hypothetical protein n=1 Tax=Actinoplanes sp. NBRC 103695 TaxID=3032202 RepID=UPI0024A40837|nr:hypothetical protein [Actinoplanes sp. NBRC 103695]GLY96605.1 hypothetical protein Acsp02_38600 [Actinoplanes sp. NBRC 103695]